MVPLQTYVELRRHLRKLERLLDTEHHANAAEITMPMSAQPPGSRRQVTALSAWCQLKKLQV